MGQRAGTVTHASIASLFCYAVITAGSKLDENPRGRICTHLLGSAPHLAFGQYAPVLAGTFAIQVFLYGVNRTTISGFSRPLIRNLPDCEAVRYPVRFWCSRDREATARLRSKP